MKSTVHTVLYCKSPKLICSILNAVHLLASMLQYAVFSTNWQPECRNVGKLGGIKQTKTKTDIPTRNADFKVE